MVWAFGLGFISGMVVCTLRRTHGLHKVYLVVFLLKLVLVVVLTVMVR